MSTITINAAIAAKLTWAEMAILNSFQNIEGQPENDADDDNKPVEYSSIDFTINNIKKTYND